MTWDTIPKWAKIVGGAVALIASLYGVFSFLDDIIKTPERLNAHVASSAVVHDSTWRAASELHEHAEQQEKLLEGLVRGECIENPKADLARQGLLRKCGELGIVR